jgi:hypothetical protein
MEDLLQRFRHGEQVIKGACFRAEADQNIQVTGGSCFSPGHGAEDAKAQHAGGTQPIADGLDGGFEHHDTILGG